MCRGPCQVISLHDGSLFVDRRVISVAGEHPSPTSPSSLPSSSSSSSAASDDDDDAICEAHEPVELACVQSSRVHPPPLTRELWQVMVVAAVPHLRQAVQAGLRAHGLQVLKVADPSEVLQCPPVSSNFCVDEGTP